MEASAGFFAPTIFIANFVKTKHLLFGGLLACLGVGAGFVAVKFFTEQASEPPKPRVSAHNLYIFFPHSTINGHTARLALDTGAVFTALTRSGADWLKLKPTPWPVGKTNSASANMTISEPIYMTAAGHTFLAQIPIDTTSRTGIVGRIGWLEVRDNILVFDATKRTLSSVTVLPPETAGWLKLKVARTGVLTLEMPLSDGKTGTLLLDTGSTGGVSLPTAQWKEWKAAHPHAISKIKHYSGPAVGAGITEEAWADEIELGALKLTDVPVSVATAHEVAFRDNFAGTLGLYALTRMDMVIDWKGGFAYLRPKPPPGPSYPGFELERLGVENSIASGATGNGYWVVENSVRLNIASILFYSSGFKLVNGDYYGAIVELDHILESEPKNAVAYYRRSIVKEIQGNFEGALADYAKAIESTTDNAPNSRLHSQLLLRRLGRPTGDFSKIVTGWNAGWNKTAGQFLAGGLSEADFMAVAAKGDEKVIPNQKCDAFYLVGMMRFINSDTAGARDFWQKCAAMEDEGLNYSALLARAELVRLDAGKKK